MVKWLKEKCDEHPYYFGIGFMVIYLSWFLLLEILDLPVIWEIECWLDAYIPFTKYAVIPYCSWFFWLAFGLLHMAGKESKQVRWRSWAPMFSGMLLCLLFCTLVPNSIALRPDAVQGNDLCALIVRVIQTADNPKSVCPSLHVYSTVMLDLGVQRSNGYKHTFVKPLARILDIAICCSTMLLKQHSIVDVMCALALAFVMDSIAEYRINHCTLPQKIKQHRKRYSV